MDYKEYVRDLYKKCKKLILKPEGFFLENRDIENGKFFSSLLVPLIVLMGAGVFLGELISNSNFLFSYALMKTLRIVVYYILVYYLERWALGELLKSHEGTQDKNLLCLVVVSSLVPSVLSSFITGLFPGLYVFGILGLYGFYLFVVGVKKCLKIPEKNQFRYILLSILLILLITGVVYSFSWKLLQFYEG
ncbi:MAG: YIP1 family protein [Prolixibacteraceae bacterium]|nr:YIP1 family protein [Prolixibacteraceae bacterium]